MLRDWIQENRDDSCTELFEKDIHNVLMMVSMFCLIRRRIFEVIRNQISRQIEFVDDIYSGDQIIDILTIFKIPRS